MTISSEWIPLLIAIASLIGSALSFHFSRQERLTAQRLTASQSTDFATQSYHRLVESLEERINHLEEEVKLLRAENKLLRSILSGNDGKFHYYDK